MGNERTKKLIGLLLILAVARFGLMPWIESQAEMRAQVQIQTRRLERSETLVLNKQLIESTDKSMTTRMTALDARFPVHGSTESFRLDAQPRIGEIASLNGMTVNVFSWVLDGEVREAGLRFARARIQLTGPLRALASFQGQMEGEMPNLIVREVALATNTSGVMPSDVLGTLTLTVDLYFRSPDARAQRGA